MECDATIDRLHRQVQTVWRRDADGNALETRATISNQCGDQAFYLVVVDGFGGPRCREHACRDVDNAFKTSSTVKTFRLNGSPPESIEPHQLLQEAVHGSPQE